MECFHLDILEKGKNFDEASEIFHFCDKNGKAREMYRQFKEKFNSYEITGKPQELPYIYMRYIPLQEEGSSVLRTGHLGASFEIGVKEEMIKLVNDLR